MLTPVRFASKQIFQSTLAVAVALVALASCTPSNSDPSTATNSVALKNHSVTPAFVKGLPSGVEAFSLTGSDDKLEQSPAFVFGGSADGAGLLKNADGTFTALVNHEDNFAVSRLTFDKTFKPVKGEYILNSTFGKWRLCSATLTNQAEHGFTRFLTCGESGEESQTHIIDPASGPNTSVIAEGFGKWSAENTVPLPRDTYAGKMVVLIGDDDSAIHGGQLAAYVSTPNDFQNGKLYILARTDNNTRERDMVTGKTYPIEFRQIPDQKTLTGKQINEKSTELKGVAFGRVEDIDYRKGSAAAAREVYFNATGLNNTGVNADYSRTKYGRVYKLVLDAADPLKGMLEVILDGDDRTGAAKTFQNVDNICVTQNYVYTQEDPNSYGDETHDSYIYQYNIATKELKVVMELDHRRTAADQATYNVGGTSRFGSWEYGAMVDVSDIIGIANTFMVSVQPHTWTGDKYKGVDGGTLRPSENQASQLIIVKGLPR